MTFAPNTTQTVEAGVIFKLWFGAQLIFDDVVINGTFERPVVVTVATDDEFGGDTFGDGPSPSAAGDYSSIHLQGTATIDHALFRYGSGIRVTGHADFDHVTAEFQQTSFMTGAIDFDVSSTGSVRNSHFRATELPVSLQSGANPALSALSSESQSLADAVLVVNGSWTSTRTWSDPGMPYYVPTGLILDGPGHSIEPGVVFKVGTGGFAKVELGSAIQGDSGRPIVFTSFLDDSVAGDTNLDGPSVGSPGDWVGMETLGGGEWSYLNVRYATTGFRILPGPTGSVRNSVFRFNGTGLRLESSDPIPWTVTDSQFVSNGIGVSVLRPNFANLGILSDTDSTNDGRNQFACNVLNLENAGPVVETVIAEGNWWGAAPPEPSLFLGMIDADPYLTDWRFSALTMLRIDRSGSSDLALDWDDVAPACGYRVLRSSGPVSGFVDSSGPVAGSSFIEAGGLVSPGDRYYLISIE